MNRLTWLCFESGKRWWLWGNLLTRLKFRNIQLPELGAGWAYSGILPLAVLIFTMLSCNPYIGENREMDAFTEVSQAFVTNYIDRDNPIKIAVLPFTPHVVIALSKLRQQKEHWTDERYYDEMQDLMISATGMAVDSASGRTANPQGWSDTPQTLLLYVHLLNTTWPCQNPTIISDYHMEKLFGLQSDIPCPQYEVDSLVAHITVNGSRATATWGKRNDILRHEETLVCVFRRNNTNPLEITIR